MCRIQTMGLMLLATTLAVGCTNKEFVFKSEPMGHGPDQYEIYTDRVPASVHVGEDTVRSGVMILPPVQPLVRTAARQKEVMTALSQFYEKMFNLDERRAKDTVIWLRKFMEEHRGLAPDQPVAIQSALDSLNRSRDRAVKAMNDAPGEQEKNSIQEKIKKMDEDIEFFQKYVETRAAKAADYQKHVDELDAANKRMEIWQARHTRMTSTIEWTTDTKGSADAELNRALRELADTLSHPDDQTKMEVLAIAVNIGGSDAKAMLPRVKHVAGDQTVNPEVRAFAARASESIEGQG